LRSKRSQSPQIGAAVLPVTDSGAGEAPEASRNPLKSGLLSYPSEATIYTYLGGGRNPLKSGLLSYRAGEAPEATIMF